MLCCGKTHVTMQQRQSREGRTPLASSTDRSSVRRQRGRAGLWLQHCGHTPQHLQQSASDWTAWHCRHWNWFCRRNARRRLMTIGLRRGAPGAAGLAGSFVVASSVSGRESARRLHLVSPPV